MKVGKDEEKKKKIVILFTMYMDRKTYMCHVSLK